jgi:phosphate starvation-inducible protein PhoH
LYDAMERLQGIPDIAHHEFYGEDIVRNPIISKILKKYENSN